MPAPSTSPERDRATGLLFDVQSYCLYDGPGIRTVVFLKGCPLRCFWCHNPESHRREPQVRFIASRCNRCGECVHRCDAGAIRLSTGELRWDAATCHDCGACADVCPEQAFIRAGEEVTVAETVERVLADRAFLERSGGGVTVSGGEPTTQAGYLLALLRALREHDLHTALDTCGHFPETLVPALLETVDLFLFDLKHMNDEKHREGTGTGNRQILANFATLLDRAGGERVTVRIPLVPRFNTGDDDVSALVTFLDGVGFDGEVHLMPYHGWARSKYESLGRLGDHRDLPELSPEELDGIRARFEGHRFEVRLHG